MPKTHYEVVIIGGGVSGIADAWMLSCHTDIRDILLLEKNPWVAQVNSHPLNNAQTSHDGGTETNYALEHALEVLRAAKMLRRYCRKKGDALLFKKSHRMVLGVTAEEVALLKERLQEFKPYYPDLFWAGPEELAKIEPKIMEGRDPNKPVGAIVSNEGYIINYQRLAECLLADAQKNNPQLAVYFSTSVKAVRKEAKKFLITTDKQVFTADVLVCAAGSYSLFFAQELGCGLDYGIDPVAGSFYSGGPLLRGKVYRVQDNNRPFAAIHGDPDILNMNDTRFGPTAKPLPLMERHHYKTMPAFGKIFFRSPFRMLWSLWKVLSKNGMTAYILKQMLYDLPIIGKALFLKEARTIVPTVRYKDLKLRRGAGGIRPQVVDLKTHKLIMGDVTILGDKCLFNTTPSPGASVCIANAERDTKRVVEFFDGRHNFDEESFKQDFLSDNHIESKTA